MRRINLAVGCIAAAAFLAAPGLARDLSVVFDGAPPVAAGSELLFEYRDRDGTLRDERRVDVAAGALPSALTLARLSEQPGRLRVGLISGGRVIAASRSVDVANEVDEVELPALLAADAMGFYVPMRCGTTEVALEPGDAELRLRAGGQDHLLMRVEAASGAHYQDGDNMVWLRGNRAMIRLDGVDLPECAPALGPLLLPMDGAGRARDGLPDWTIALSADGLRLQIGTAPALEQTPLPPFADGRGAIVFDTDRFRLRLDPHPCRPGGDALQLPVSVTLSDLDERSGRGLPSDVQLRGCAGTPSELLAGAPWRIDSLLGLPVDADLPDMPDLTFQVLQDRVAGRAACNRYFGSVEFDTHSLRFGEMAMTRMACPAALMALESRFLDALERVNRFEITNGGRLVLYSGSVPLMTARR